MTGKALDHLDLPHKDGRIDLRQLNLPDPTRVPEYATSSGTVERIEGGAVVRNAKWNDLDFSNSKLKSLRLFDSELTNCSFDDCDLTDLRVWSTEVSRTSFTRANLKEAALGGVKDGRRNTFDHVDFTEADLTRTAYTAASFRDCTFANAKLRKINFQTSEFTDCVFEGLLSNVLFYRRGYGGEAFPTNEMINVDFRRATLRFVEFRGLTLDRVLLPEDDQHLVLRPFPGRLDRIINALQPRSDMTSRKLVAYLGVLRKWAPPEQVQGVLNKEDLVEISGIDGLRLVMEVLTQ